MANTFGTRLQEERKKMNLSRADLAKLVSLSDKSIQNYESGKRYPNNLEIANRIAAALGTTVQYLMGEEGPYISDARQKGGAKSAREVRELVEDVSGCFAGGELPDEDLDAMMKALTEAYFIAKEKNKIYAPKKYRSTDEE